MSALRSLRASAPVKSLTQSISAGWILRSAAMFIAILVIFRLLPQDVSQLVLPLVLLASFAFAALKAPPVAIALLLYYAMTLGSWLILAAAPVTVLLARRYQRHRLVLDLNPIHIRRTSLFAMVALLATLPFIGLSLGPWSSRGQSSSFDSARPLIEEAQPGEEGPLQRFARWLGFGPEAEPLQQGPLVPSPVRPREDPSFNWWIVVLIAIIVAMLALAWWLWRRINAQPGPEFAPAAAAPLARLEAIGASIGRPRQPSEGAITYGRVLAERTGDSRLAQTGPLVSGQVYQSAFADPGTVNQSLEGIEAAPPPAPPRPPVGERIAQRAQSLTRLAPAIGFAVLAAALVAVAVFVVVPRLDDFDSNRFDSGLEQRVVAPFVAQDLDDLV